MTTERGTTREQIFELAPELKDVLVRPKIAWPTIILFWTTLALWLFGTYTGVTGILPVWLAVLINGAAVYLFFTIMHDASHRSVSTISFLNEAYGLASMVFFGPVTFGLRAFRYLHMQHHRFTNDDHLDPDHWVIRGPKLLRPLMWATIDVNYIIYYLGHLKERPRAELAEALLYTLGGIGILIVLIMAGYGWEALFYWVIPARIGLFTLAFAFDFLPHYPHNVKSVDNPYKATCNRVGSEVLMTPALLYHNYHLCHHLFPLVPFYRYKKIWKAGENYFLTKDPYLRTPTGKPLAKGTK